MTDIEHPAKKELTRLLSPSAFSTGAAVSLLGTGLSAVPIVMETATAGSTNLHLPRLAGVTTSGPSALASSLAFPLVGKVPFATLGNPAGASLVILPTQLVQSCYGVQLVPRSDPRSVQGHPTTDVLDLSKGSDEVKDVTTMPPGGEDTRRGNDLCNRVKGEDDFDEDSSDQRSVDEYVQHGNGGRGIHSFSADISIAPLQVHSYSEAHPATALILCRD